MRNVDQKLATSGFLGETTEQIREQIAHRNSIQDIMRVQVNPRATTVQAAVIHTQALAQPRGPRLHSNA